MVHCTIELGDNYQAIYHAGQLLKGTIELYLNEPRKFRGLYFIVYGAATCHWEESETEEVGDENNHRRVTKLIHFDGIEVYLNTKTYLFGFEDANPFSMTMGTHRFDFSCQLPPNIPASYEAEYGHIRYNIKAALDLPWDNDMEFNLPFTVVRDNNLNLQPNLKIPSQSEEIRRFCCLFCNSDPLIMTVTLPRTGYIPGETINITVKYNNKSNIEFSRTNFTLIKFIRYNSQTPSPTTKTESLKMVEMSASKGVYASSSNTFKENLEIPLNTICSNGHYCKVVEIYYEVKVEAETSGCNDNIELSIPIIIGSIPFNDDSTEITQPTAPLEALLIEPIKTLTPSQNPIPDSPPPTFDEAMHSKSHLETTNKESQPFFG